MAAMTAAAPIQSFPWLAAAESLRKKSSWFPPGNRETCRTRYLSVLLIHRWLWRHLLCMPSPYRRWQGVTVATSFFGRHGLLGLQRPGRAREQERQEDGRKNGQQ